MQKKRKIGKAFLFILCCMLLQMTAMSVNAQAAKSGLVKSGKKIYYYKDGKKVKNCWKTVKGSKYYFGKDGAAYMAPKAAGKSKQVVCKKIGKQRYCFDKNGRMVKKGVYAAANGDIYVVTKNGTVDQKSSKKYRKALKYLANAKTIRKYLGKPQKTTSSSSCLYDGGTDLILTYPNVILSLSREQNGTEHVLYLEPR